MSEELARLFHDTYERLAPEYGYNTREDTKQFDPESANGKLMIAVCSEVMAKQQVKINRLRSLVSAAWDAGCAYTVGSHENFQQTHPDKQEWMSKNAWETDQ